MFVRQGGHAIVAWLDELHKVSVRVGSAPNGVKFQEAEIDARASIVNHWHVLALGGHICSPCIWKM